MKSTIIERPHYLRLLRQWQGNGLVKVIMGPRRCGKSVLLELFRDELRKTEGVSSDQIITFELDRFEQERFLDPKLLHDEVLKRWNAKKQTFLFIDEVQECKGFEKVLASLQGRDNLDIYVTGSNAYMLSGELATYLTGRYLPVEMQPLSFAEYRSAVEGEGRSLAADFNLYVSQGSFPALAARQGDSEFRKVYYEALIADMIYKDVVPRYRIRDTSLLMRVVTTMAGSLGSPLSARKIANTLTSAGVQANSTTVSSYFRALEDCYLFFKAPRFDIRGRESLRSQEKYYLCDPGFRQYLVHSTAPDYGHLLENVVYLELKRRFPFVQIGKAGENEIDFVAQDGDQYFYVQVAQSVMDPATLARELKPLEALRDSYPRYLLTLDEWGANRSINGVQQLNVLDWLMKTNPAVRF